MGAADEACVLNMNTGPEIARRQLHSGFELTDAPAAPRLAINPTQFMKGNCPRRLGAVAPAWLCAAMGEGEAPLERTVRDLADEVVLARGVVVGLALTLDGEDVVHQGHRDILRIHARQGELHDVGAVLDPPLHGGEQRGTLSGFIPGAVEEPLE